MIIIPALIISFVPCIALYLWLRKLHGSDEVYRKLCSTAFVRGILSVFLIVLLSALTHILVGFLGIRDRYPLLYEAFYTFIVLALVEEIVKFRVSRKVLRQTDYPYSWVDVTAILDIVLVIILIRFVRKTRGQERYTEPLPVREGE